MLAFRVGRLIDGSGAKALEQACLVVEGKTITALGPQAEVAIPEGSTIIEAPEASLMPGMVDVHVHLAYSGIAHKRAFRAESVELSYPLMALRAAAHAQATLRAGFTAVRDVHAPGGVAIDLRDAINAGYVSGPTIRASGLGLCPTGGHMDQPGFGDHLHFRDMNAACDGPDAFRKGAREQVKRGADLIKINVCVSSVKDPDRPYRQEMSDEEIAAVCEEARRLERPVAAHTSGGPAIAKAVELGLNTVEHGHWLDQRTVELMAEKGAYYVPTLLVNERNFDFSREEMGASEASWQWLEQVREQKWQSLERARQAGVKIAVGTDAGFMLPHGEMNAKELALLVQGGLSSSEALQAATQTGAELMGLNDAGTLTVGKRADLLLVAGNPLEDISILQNTATLRVFKDGKEVD